VDEEALKGGVANAGAVVRVGKNVLRPSNPYTTSIHSFLRALRSFGFEGAPVPLGIDPDGRERLEFIEGDVAVPPFPDWVQSDESLCRIAVLMRLFHDASRRFDSTGFAWSKELADLRGGPIVCHNDVCLENVVFRNGEAVGLLDFDFAAPGRPVVDVAHFARMCVPIDDEVNSAKLGWVDLDRPVRLRLVAETYGLNGSERAELLDALDFTIANGGDFVRRRVRAGDPNFTEMWNQMGGERRFQRRHRWWQRHRNKFVAALC
jgi:hypothetical protein